MNAILVRIGDFLESIAGRIIAAWEAEPLAITTLVTVLLDAAVAFGAPIDDAQKTALVAVVSALGVLIARQQVTPVAAPVLPGGTQVTVTTPPGEPDKVVVLPR